MRAAFSLGTSFVSIRIKPPLKIRGILRRGRLDNLEIVDLRGGDNVEGEGAGVGFARRDGRTVDPNVVIALRETAHHDEFLVDNRNAWHTADDLRGVLVLRTLNLLCGYAALHHETVALDGHHGCFGIAGCLTRDHGHAQQIVGKAHGDEQQRVGMLVVKGALLFGVGNIVEGQMEGLPLARAFQLEAARFIRCQSLIGFFHFDGCAHQGLASFSVYHAATNLLRRNRHTQSNHPTNSEYCYHPLPHVFLLALHPSLAIPRALLS